MTSAARPSYQCPVRTLMMIAVVGIGIGLQSNRAAAEPAEIEVKGESQIGGWGKQGRVRLPRGAWAERLSIDASPRLVELELKTTSKEKPWHLLTDLRPDHHYRVRPDPCCVIAIIDDDSDLRPADRASPSCEAGKRECAPGTTSVPSFIAYDPRCGEGDTCVEPIEVQLDVAPAALAAGPLALFVGDLADSPLAVATVGDTTWRSWPWTRETSPVRVQLRRGKQVIWSRHVQLRLAHRYRIVIPADPTQLSIVREK